MTETNGHKPHWCRYIIQVQDTKGVWHSVDLASTAEELLAVMEPGVRSIDRVGNKIIECKKMEPN